MKETLSNGWERGGRKYSASIFVYYFIIVKFPLSTWASRYGKATGPMLETSIFDAGPLANLVDCVQLYNYTKRSKPKSDPSQSIKARRWLGEDGRSNYQTNFLSFFTLLATFPPFLPTFSLLPQPSISLEWPLH